MEILEDSEFPDCVFFSEERCFMASVWEYLPGPELVVGG